MIVVPHEGNPWFPLPPDYPERDPEGQREARLAVLRNQSTPDDLVWAWAFFRNYYLRQSRMRFYKRFRESPPFHYQIVRDIGLYPYNAVAAPRGFSKSSILAIEIPLLLLLTRPFFNIFLVFSKDTMVTKRMNTQILPQLRYNEYIRADFGDMVPSKGKGAASAHLLQLKNGATLECQSVKGGMQGPRPDLVLIDDAETDPALQKVTTELTSHFDNFINRVVMPMLDLEDETDEGVSLYIIGTLHRLDCYLYYLLTSDDERFLYWNRRRYDAEDDGHGRLLWEEKFPRERLEREKRVWGIAAYNASRRNRPGLGEEKTLQMTKERNGYVLLEEDDALITTPFSSNAILRSWVPTENEDGHRMVERPYGETVGKMFRVMLMDYAQCLSATSDYIAMVVVGSETSRLYRNTWWVLDLYVGRLRGSAWVRKFWAMALKWRVMYAGIEAVAAQEHLVGTANEFAEQLREAGGFTPRPVPIKYPHGLTKEERIAALEWRFLRGRVKLPTEKRQEWPWKELFTEIDAFSGMPGATPHDDALDALAMTQFLLKGPRRYAEEGPEAKPLHERVSTGEVVTPEGVQIGLGIPAEYMDSETLWNAMRAHPDFDEGGRPDTAPEGRRSWIAIG